MPHHPPYKVPSGWDAEACRLWAAGQAHAALQAVIAALNARRGGMPALSLQLAYYFFLKADYRSAAAVLEQQARLTPDHPDVQLNLAVCYSRIGRCADSVPLLEQVLRVQPENPSALDGMTTCLRQLGREDEAARAGTRVLEIKDRQAGTAAGWSPPADTPDAFAGDKARVIAFSLWGDGPRYLRGALRNALLAPDLYPGWTCRFHADASVPGEFLGLLDRLGAQVVMHPAGQSLRQRLAWRFRVANDPAVGRFLVRDVDSVISPREMRAVDEWLASGAWFHVMRDWWTHTDLVLAGMWGGVAGVLPDLEAMLAGYVSRHAETPNIDQWFLRDRVWAHLRTSCLAHDRCFSPPGARPFPGPAAPPRFHVGQNEYAAHRKRQARLLGPWIEKFPCLGAAEATH